MKLAVKIHLEEKQLAWMRRAADKRGCSLSQIVRDCVAEKMAEDKAKGDK